MATMIVLADMGIAPTAQDYIRGLRGRICSGMVGDPYTGFPEGILPETPCNCPAICA
jgi:hypothetical protein